MNEFDLLGAEAPARPKVTWTRTAIALGAGVFAAMTVKKHPVLAFFGAAAAASNAQAALVGDRTWKDAFRRMGRHVVATAGSLSIPKHPALGYVAGAVAGDLLFDGEGNGVLEDWTSVVKPERKDVIDAEFVEVPTKTTALAKVGP